MLDLRAVADDGRVGKEPLGIGVAEARHRVRMEPGERRPERVAATLAGVEDGKPLLAPPKTLRSRREVHLSEMAAGALRAHRTRQLEGRLEAGQHWQDNDLVFTNAFGRPLDGNNVRERSFKALLKNAGLPAMRFHNLRHAAASLLMAEGVGIKVISEMLGHADIPSR